MLAHGSPAALMRWKTPNDTPSGKQKFVAGVSLDLRAKKKLDPRASKNQVFLFFFIASKVNLVKTRKNNSSGCAVFF
jgi:hypothetical protein